MFLVLLSLSGVVSADEEARQLFETRCAICHQLPEPAMLKPNQWRVVLMTMQKRMEQRGLPPLSEEEFTLLLKYLSEQGGR